MQKTEREHATCVMLVRALILDFDGLILDTETPEFQAWQEVYASEGVHLELADWLNAVGYVNGFDPRAHLEKLTQRTVDWSDVNPRRAKRLQDLVDQQRVLPGVNSLLKEGEKSGYRLAVASNSDASWVRPKLEQLGLSGYFQTVLTREMVPRPKPFPDVYLRALAELGADAASSFAFEDSEPGVQAAHAAGLQVIAVPNVLTAHQDLSLANMRLRTLEHFVFPG